MMQNIGQQRMSIQPTLLILDQVSKNVEVLMNQVSLMPVLAWRQEKNFHSPLIEKEIGHTMIILAPARMVW